MFVSSSSSYQSVIPKMKKNSALKLVTTTTALLLLSMSSTTSVNAIMPTGAIDITYYTSDGSGTGKQHAVKETQYATMASFGSRLPVGGSTTTGTTSNTYKPILPPVDDTHLCDSYSDVSSSATSTFHQTSGGTSTSGSEQTVMLIPRGNCTFESKVLAAQTLGANAAVIYGTLGSRYGYNTTTQTISWPLNKHDYECNNGGKSWVSSAALSFVDGIGYNAPVNDALLTGDDNLCQQTNTKFNNGCSSKQCLLTGETKEDTGGSDYVMYAGCCAWDMNVWLYTDPNIGTNAVSIPSVFVKTEDGNHLMDLIYDESQSSSSVVSLLSLTLYERPRPEYNVSALIIWALGVFVAFLAAYYSAADFRDEMKRIKANVMGGGGDALYSPLNSSTSSGNSSSITRDDDSYCNHTQKSGGNFATGDIEVLSNTIPRQQGSVASSRQQRQQGSSSSEENQAPVMMQEESLELTPLHALIFLVMSSASLLILFYFKIYNFVRVMYGIGCSGAVSQVIFYPLIRNIIGYRILKIPTKKLDTPALKLCDEELTKPMIMAAICGYGLGIVWLITYFTSPPHQADNNTFYWITQDVMGACICITFLGVIRLNSIRVAAVLLTVAFVYDIFMVFITPYIFNSSVMITVATSGGPPTADPTWCEKYPKSDGCTGGDPLPMLFTIPRLFDYQGGSSLLGLGDIVLPGLLLSFACRFDNAKRLVGLTSQREGGDASDYGAGGCRHSSSTTPPTLDRPLWCGYFVPTTVAYAVGLMMANMAVYVMDMGQPALLYLVPCCLGTMMVLANQRGEMTELWKGPRVLATAERILDGNDDVIMAADGNPNVVGSGGNKSMNDSRGMFT